MLHVTLDNTSVANEPTGRADLPSHTALEHPLAVIAHEMRAPLTVAVEHGEATVTHAITNC